MFFDLSALDLLVLGLLAVVLFGPDRLPEAVRTAARMLKYVRSLQAQAAATLDPRVLVGEELAAEVAEARLLAREVVEPLDVEVGSLADALSDVT